jgi:septal ring factor EnvC (AmiA/AmiB activator)
MAEKEVERLKRYTEELRATVSDLSRQLHSARKSATDVNSDRDRSSEKKPKDGEEDEEEEGGGGGQHHQPRVLLLPQWPTVRNVI